MTIFKKGSALFTVLSAVFGAAIFITDLLLPLGITIGILYVTAMAFTIRAPRLSAPLVFASVFSGFTLIGWYFSPPGSESLYVMFNRVFAIMGIWSIGLAIYEIRYAKAKLQKETGLLKDTMERLETTTERLKRSNEDLERFSYTVSHDLRAPLRALQGFSQKLTSEYSNTFDDRGIRWLSYIKNNAEKMDLLISDLLAFSRLDRQEIQRRKINSSDLVKSVLSDLRIIYAEQEADISLTSLPEVYADPKLLRLVYQNLLDNAFKYTSRCDVSRIAINGWEDPDHTYYSVSDNGIGFDMKFRERIFTPFERLEVEEDYPGTGIGLASVKNIIDKHGGEIWAEKNQSKGTIFTFKIPKQNINTGFN